mgnify:CR=1 FL=1
MSRYFWICPLVLLLLAGCQGGKNGADGTAPPTDGESTDSSDDGSSADGDPADGTAADGTDADGSATDGTSEIVRPTVDDSQERAKVREMEVSQLVESLSDSELGDAASDELAARGNEAVQPLIEALDNSDVAVQQKAIFTLGQIGPAASDALPKLQELAAEGDSEVVQDSAKFAIDAIEGN